MRPRQVQDFIPTPMAIATTMYYTGIDPLTERARVHRTRSAREADDEGAALLLGRAALAARARGAPQGGPRAISSASRPAGTAYDCPRPGPRPMSKGRLGRKPNRAR